MNWHYIHEVNPQWPKSSDKVLVTFMVNGYAEVYIAYYHTLDEYKDLYPYSKLNDPYSGLVYGNHVFVIDSNCDWWEGSGEIIAWAKLPDPA